MEKQKVLLYDLETSFNKAYCFGKYEQNINQYQEESRLLSFAYKWLGESKIYCLSENEVNNEKLVKKLWEVLDEADIIVAHNAKRFDNRKSCSYFLEDRLTPPSPYKVFDTREFARNKFGFNSNSLDDLGEHLGLGKKERILDKDKMWVRLTDRTASKQDWSILKKYNKKDVALLEKVYLLFRPWTTNHAPIHHGKEVCQMCGGSLMYRGFSFLASGLKKQRVVCKSCGKWGVLPITK